MRRTTPLIVVVLVAACSAPSWAGGPDRSSSSKLKPLPENVARVLRHVPDDTHLLLVVPRLDALVDGAAAFGRATRIPELAGLTAQRVLEDPLGTCAQGLNRQGCLVLAVSAQRYEPLLLGEAGDLSVWAGQAQVSTLGDATLYEFPDQRYAVSTSAGVLLFAREKADLERAVTANGEFIERLTPEVRTLYATRDVVFWADLQAWRPTIQRWLGFFAQTMYMGMAAAGPDAEAAIQIYKTLFDHADQVLAEAETYAAAARVDGDGVLAEDRLFFKADGAVAKFLASVEKPGRDLLRGLPFVGAIAFGSEWEVPPGTASLNEMFARAIFSTPAIQKRLSAEQVEELMNHTVRVYQHMTGLNGCIDSHPEGGLLICGLYMTQTPATLQQDLRRGFEQKPEMLGAWYSVPAASMEHARERLGDVEADVYQVSFELPEHRPMQPMIQAIYGSGALGMYVAPHPEGVVYAMGPQDAARDVSVKLLSADGPTARQDPRTEALFERLSPDPQMCVVVDLPRTMQMMAQVVERIGMPSPPMDAGAKPAALIGLNVYLEPRTVRTELYAPSAPIRAVREVFEDLEAAEEGAY